MDLSGALGIGFNPAATARANQSGTVQPEPDGLIDSFNIGDTLTDKDKGLVGWDPGSGKINQAAIALAGYRHNGSITGDIGADFVEAIKNSISKTGGYPMNPAMLMAKGAQQDPLSSDTYAALLAMI